jgi:phage terminase large subunit
MEIKATTVFERNYEAIHSDKRYIINQGGSRSSKSWSVCQLIIVLALEEPGTIISIIRKTFPALRASIMRDFFAVLKSFGQYEVKRHNKTEHTYTFKNGSIVEFFSVDNEQKIRGRKRDYAFVDEANQLWEDDFFQLNLRTTKKLVFLYNPSDRASWLYELPKDDSIFIKSTYHDNPFLEDVIVKEIEALKEKDEALYTIFALGERAITRENIYSNWEFVSHKPERFTQFVYGIDYGFTHPTSLVKIWYWEDEVYVEDLIYEAGLTSTDIINKMRELGITFKDTIIAEVARPEINEELRRENFTIIQADKNVKGGINDVQRTKVYTSSRNIWKEYENYSWKKVAGQLTEEPIKILDDALDAIRYAVRYITKYYRGNTKTYVFH